MEIKLLTEEQAKTKLCPKRVNANFYFNNCVGPKCMCWLEVEAYVRREDHSGSTDLMNEEALRRGLGAVVLREGPRGCTGKLYLEARGRCGLVHP